MFFVIGVVISEDLSGAEIFGQDEREDGETELMPGESVQRNEKNLPQQTGTRKGNCKIQNGKFC
jgi:hypothetical protein